MSKSKKINSCLIIGAGISGLCAARVLQDQGKKVIVLDKGRGVGGRMATRRMDNGVIDHGAQYFTAHDEQFKKWVQNWIEEGTALEWSRGFPALDKDSIVQTAEGDPHYRGTKGMTTIPKQIARDLEVHVHAAVNRIAPLAKGWEAQTEEGQKFRAHALILTPPVPQILSILEASKIGLPSPIQSSLHDIRYDHCLAVLALIDGLSHIPYPGGLHLPGEPVSWIADNHRKGISLKQMSIIIHAGPQYSRENWKADDHSLITMLTEEVAKYVGSRILKAQVHRWHYSKPTRVYPKPCLAVPGSWPMIFAGDAFGAPHIEGAVLSGIAAAHQILS